MNRIWTTACEHKTTLVTLSAIAGFCGIVAIVRHQRSTTVPLRRRNAVRRRVRSHFTVAASDHPDGQDRYRLTVHAADNLVFSLTIGEHALPDRRRLEYILNIDKDSADRLYGQMIDAAVHNYMHRLSQASNVPSLPHLIGDQSATVIDPDNSHSETLAQILGVEDVSLVQRHVTTYFDGISSEGQHDGGTETIAVIDGAVDELKALLYHIAEDRSKREAYLHRGIRCEECGETPIRSVRWHCLHCPDYDLCSSCKALTTHQRSHVFAEIQIPIPVLAQPVEKLPLWYSGKPNLVRSNLQPRPRRRLAQKHGFSEDEIDALAAQFSCLVDTTLETDSSGLHAAIGYGSFFRSLTSATWRPRMRSSMILERIFSFYDRRHTGIIDFDDFVSGIAYLRGDQRFSTLERALRGFDIDDDGFVSRADCMRLLQAKFEIQSHIIHEMGAREDAEYNPLVESFVLSNQPISSAFQGDIPEGQSREPTDKTCDRYGDMVPDSRHDATGSQHEENEMETSSPGCLPGARPSIDPNMLSETEKAALGLIDERSGDLKSIMSPDTALLWKMVGRALDDSLDMIFKPAEDMLQRINSTASQRSRLQKEIQAYRNKQRDAKRKIQVDAGKVVAQPRRKLVVELSLEESEQIQTILSRSVARTDEPSLAQMENEIRSQSLAQLLDDSGYGVRDGQSLPAQPSSATTTSQTSETSTSQTGEMPTSLSGSRSPVQTDEASPSQSSQIPSGMTDPAGQIISPNDRYSPKEDETQEHSDEHLAALAEIDEAAQNTRVREGHVCLRIEDIVSIVEKDSTGELAGILRSWLEWASF